MRDFSDALSELRRRVEEAQSYLRVDEARARLGELEDLAGQPDLWDNQDRARAVTTEMAQVRADVELTDSLQMQISDLETLHELVREAGDESLEPEVEEGCVALRAELDRLELRALFTGEHDERDAIVSISSGAGGVDAQDWAEMLLRMYTRWAQRQGFTVELDDRNEGQEAGISSATITIHGRYAYGMMQAEKGVHRLIRISPFDANARRQTGFAALDVVPTLEEAEVPEIREEDLRIDTFRSSGAGGQHVNVTDSAVRMTHLPTGIVVSCQNERSQLQNRAKALQQLGAKLAERARAERQAEIDKISGDKRENAFGSQIRSYTMAPYQLVKDERTKYETGNIAGVLDGDVDAFIESWLQWRRRDFALE